MPFRIALSGLNAASAELRVVANNIANVSTTGFKKSRTEFADIYSVASLGNAGIAIGSGVSVAAVSQQFSQGNISFTDNGLDLAVSGQGFFRLSDQGSTVYTRSGAFSVNREGYIVNPQNARLTAYLADNNGNVTGALGDLQLNTSDISPQPTTSIAVGVNLDATAPIPPAFNITDPTTYNNSTSLTVYDSLGTAHLSEIFYRKSAANTWETRLFIDGAEVTPTTNGDLTFNPDGTLATPAGGQVAYNSFPILGANNLNVVLDYSASSPSTQFGSKFGVNFLDQDGFTTGRLSGLDISDNGIVQARFTNGQSRTLGQVALANFANLEGLRQLGDTTWAESFESGVALIGQPGTASLGLIQSGALEDSNVDLTEQLVAMITAQRNFQANSQVISAADTVTQTIINIR